MRRFCEAKRTRCAAAKPLRRVRKGGTLQGRSSNRKETRRNGSNCLTSHKHAWHRRTMNEPLPITPELHHGQLRMLSQNAAELAIRVNMLSAQLAWLTDHAKCSGDKGHSGESKSATDPVPSPQQRASPNSDQLKQTVWEAIIHPHGGTIDGINGKQRGCEQTIDYLLEHFDLWPRDSDQPWPDA